MTDDRRGHPERENACHACVETGGSRCIRKTWAPGSEALGEVGDPGSLGRKGRPCLHHDSKSALDFIRVQACSTSPVPPSVTAVAAVFGGWRHRRPSHKSEHRSVGGESHCEAACLGPRASVDLIGGGKWRNDRSVGSSCCGGKFTVRPLHSGQEACFSW